MDDLLNVQLLRHHYEQLCRQLNPELVFNIVFGCIWIRFVWRFYVSYRQVSTILQVFLSDFLSDQLPVTTGQ